MKHINPEQLFIFDIETVPGVADFHDLDSELQSLFDQKTARSREPLQSAAEHYAEKAGILAEFGKVIVISCGYMQKSGSGYQLKIKNYSGHDEKLLLQSFSETLQNISRNNYFLCGHNIREFDVPWLCRRMLINGLPLPPVLICMVKNPGRSTTSTRLTFGNSATLNITHLYICWQRYWAYQHPRTILTAA